MRKSAATTSSPSWNRPEERETGALAWAATRVTISKTGNWVRLPKFENTAPELTEDEEQRVVKITPHDT